MSRRLIMLLAALALAPGLVAAPASAPAYALENARIVSMNGPVIASGTLVMRDGRIAAVGADVETPADAIAIDASGWTLYPGFIDAHSALGMPKPKEESAREAAERRERGDPTPGLQANVRATTLYAPDSDGLDAYRRMGVTVSAIASSNGILRGQSAVIALSDGPLDDSDLVLVEPWAQHIGYRPFSRQRNDYPGTLMGVLATIRQSLRTPPGIKLPGSATRKLPTHSSAHRSTKASPLSAPRRTTNNRSSSRHGPTTRSFARSPSPTS